MKRRSKFGIILALVYLAVFVLAQLYTIHALVQNPANSEMSGIFGVLVTLPWSLILTPIWNALGFIDWYGKFSNSPVIYGLFGTLAILPGAVINAAVAYWLGKIIDGRPKEQAGPGA